MTSSNESGSRSQVPAVSPLRCRDSGRVFSTPHTSYHTLGHCLRSDIFPGAPVRWASLAKDSYTSQQDSQSSTGPQQWHGRRADDLVRWTERHIVNQRLKRALRQMNHSN